METWRVRKVPKSTYFIRDEDLEQEKLKLICCIFFVYGYKAYETATVRCATEFCVPRVNGRG